MSNNKITLDAITAAAAAALFESYKLDVAEADSFTEPSDIYHCGVIGFTGPHMRGSLLLAMSKEVIDHSAPVSGDITDPNIDLRDWTAELSNQLLGRVKNALLRRDTEIYITMPIVLRGEHIRPLTREAMAPIVFTCNEGQVRVWVDCEYAKDYELPVEDVKTADELPSEGDALLF